MKLEFALEGFAGPCYILSSSTAEILSYSYFFNLPLALPIIGTLTKVQASQQLLNERICEGFVTCKRLTN